MDTETPETVDSPSNPSGRTEIDTSAPFESVKEAANRFGGMGFWKPSSPKPERDDCRVVDVVELEAQAARLERDLVAKERETLDVLKELESTKNTVQHLKSELKRGSSEINGALEESPHENREASGNDGFSQCPSSAPGFILLELKKAKMNLTRTTSDLADIRATVDLYNKKIEHEKASLEKTRRRLTSNASKISSLEEELNQTRQKHDEVQDAPHVSSNITRQLQQLSSETEQFKKVGQAAKLQVQRAMSEIEQTRAMIKTAEVRLIAAKRMKEVAHASERMALAEIRALSKGSGGPHQGSGENVTITMEEYSSLVSKAKESEKACEARVDEAMVGVEQTNLSRAEILKSVEEALEEVKISKKAMEEALGRVEIANKDKLAAEEALRAWGSKHGRKRRPSVQNPTKFKSSHSSFVRREEESILVDVSDEVKPVLKSTLSIGEILSRKLMLTEEYENEAGKRKVSLGQLLGKPSGCDPCKKLGKENKEAAPAGKRKKFGFGRISVLVAKQSKKKKKKKKN